MALITIPNIRTASMNMELMRGDIANTLMHGGAVITAPPQALWHLQFPLVTQKLVTTRAWFSALVRLSKLSNTFKITPPAWFPGAGYGGAAPLVAGASQLGLFLNCDGVTPSTTIALDGDFIEIPLPVGSQFVCLTQDAISDGAGLVTFNFEPALRDSPADNAVVEVITPQITMRLVSPRAGWAAKLPDFYDITLEAIEHFGPQG